MDYKELKKIYYQSESDYVQEYKARFHSPDAVHLDFFIGEHRAFFVENTEVLRLALDITRTDKKVAKLSGLLPGIAREQYSKKCLIDEIVLTNKIEGVHSSRKEIGEALDVLEAQSQERHEHPRFLGLVNKYLKLMSEENIPISTCQDIRAIYDEVFLEEVVAEDPENRPDGKIFRKGPESIYGVTGKVIHTGVYPEEKIIENMQQALEFLNNDETEVLYRICLFHYLIEYIHPFYDGNGRLGRFILSYCISRNLEPLTAYRLSETIKENKRMYEKAFSSCNHPLNMGDLTPFLIMQLTMIGLAMHDLQRSLEKRLIRWNRYTEIISILPWAEEHKMHLLYHYLIQAALFSEGGIPTEGIKELLQVKSPTTMKKLLDKIPSELLVCKVKERKKYYQLDLTYLEGILRSCADHGEEGSANI